MKILTKSKYAKCTHYYYFRETNQRTYFWLTHLVLCWLQTRHSMRVHEIFCKSVETDKYLLWMYYVCAEIYWLWVTLQVFTDSGTPALPSSTVCCSRNPKSNIWTRLKWVEAHCTRWLARTIPKLDNGCDRRHFKKKGIVLLQLDIRAFLWLMGDGLAR